MATEDIGIANYCRARNVVCEAILEVSDLTQMLQRGIQQWWITEGHVRIPQIFKKIVFMSF